MFAELDPAAFSRGFGRWQAACQAAGLIPIAFDGNSARAAGKKTATGRRHVVSACAADTRWVLGTESVADGLNEIAAIPELLHTLDLAGAMRLARAPGKESGVTKRLKVGWDESS